MTPAQHLTRYPQARSSTLAYLIRKAELHERMRKEEAARRRRERFERFLRIVGMGRR